jgi:uncharacterized membrane protein YidH (DUF202 family)
LSPPPDDIEYADPGLAGERTRLAWTRSSISFAAIGAAILKARPLVGAPLLLLAVAIWAVGRLPRSPGHAAVASRRVLLVTVGVNLVALVALAIALLGHSTHGLQLLPPRPPPHDYPATNP